MADFSKIKEYLLELDYSIVQEDAEDEVFIVNDEDTGVKNLVIGCADPILIMEQFILELQEGSDEVYKELLKKNREIVHGALVLDESGTKVIFRDTLQMENLDLNELEGSINSLSLLLSEFYDDLISYAKRN